MAGAVRFESLDWDTGFTYTPHPDERALLMKSDEISFPKLSEASSFLNPETSTWNPRWFAYGSFPIYLLKIAESLEPIIPDFIDQDIRILARTLSSLSDIGTIIGISLLAKMILNRRYALVVGVLVSFSVIHIQLSHYFAVDTLATFFCIWGIFFLCRISITSRKSDSIFAGIFIGLALSSKISVLPIYSAFFTAHFLYIVNNINLKEKSIWNTTFLTVSIGLLTSILTFLIAQPYSILDWSSFSSDITEQSEMVRQIRDYPYTRQYINTIPYVYQIVQLGKWGLGWPLTIISATGLFWFWNKGVIYSRVTLLLILLNIISIGVLLTYNNLLSILLAMTLSLGSLWVTIPFRSKLDHRYLVILSWVIPYLLITGSFEVKFTRYLLPIIPFLILLGIGFVH
jgi:4-amino-4-deoxy-L-arabinose transferase-like glycosyltransferase